MDEQEKEEQTENRLREKENGKETLVDLVCRLCHVLWYGPVCHRSAFPVGYFTIPSVPHSKVLPGGGYMDAVMSGEVVCI